MNHHHAKHVIIGAGAMGSAAAYHLARRGEPVLLIEQFALGHDRGSSHGAARITRHSYADPAYARLMPAAFRAWRELEASSGETVFFRTGGVSFSPPGVDYTARVEANLEELGVPHWRSSGKAWNARHPAYTLPGDYDVVFEPDAGMLSAARAVAIMVELARQDGGAATAVLEHTPVRRIDLDGDRPVVVTDAARITAERLIISAGAWLKRLLPGLAVPLRVCRQQVLYLMPDDPAPFRIGSFPVFIFKGASDLDAFYGMPAFLNLGVKAARHGGPEVDPQNVDRTPSEEAIASVRRFMRDHIPALEAARISQTEVCLYTVAPGEQFQVDFMPGRRDVLIASPCSGHGFKFSCLIGRALADLATSGGTDLAIGAWRIVAANTAPVVATSPTPTSLRQGPFNLPGQ
jgi:sarcosine oxidase